MRSPPTLPPPHNLERAHTSLSLYDGSHLKTDSESARKNYQSLSKKLTSVFNRKLSLLKIRLSGSFSYKRPNQF